MQYMSSVDFISLIFHILIGINLANALLRCYETGNFTTNSTYAKNRDLIISSLASNLSANGGFFTTTVGQGTDEVYGMRLCRADISSEDCSKCINATTTYITENCPNQKESLAWFGDPGPCHIHYANRSFFGQLELSPSQSLTNTGDISSNINISEFDQIWTNLMDSLIKRASMGTSKVKFATGEEDITPFEKIYALMQCTPDLSKINCDSCLRQAAATYLNCCHGKRGGIVLMPSCNFRWDLYPFYNSIAEAPPPTPTSTPSPPPPFSIRTENGNFAARTVVISVVPTIILIAIIALICALFHYRKPKQDTKKDLAEHSSQGCQQFNNRTIRLATDDFSDNNKLGQGGFGSVYKGVLPDGQLIAVKRLSKSSKQGEVQFINEVKLLAKLQHRNLVRLLGFCFEGNEKLLIYEFVPNSSLDHFIFDEGKRLLMDWKTRYKIIMGIARGILYLHEDSQLRIIHRDLKLSNILLDDHMNPKISDFGIAKLFGTDQSQHATSNVMGTYGYMAPEYAMHGVVSVKSDVFSFGVLLLEIISGQKNSNFKKGEEEGNLLNYAWDNWNQGTASNIIDPIIIEVAWRSEILRCINIGLLCLQEDAMKRPNMASVVLMLDSYSLALSTPSRPAYHLYSSMEQQKPFSSSLDNSESTLPSHLRISSVQNTINEASITELEPR